MFATIYLPNFYLQAALRHEPDLRDKPAALIADQGKRLVVIQLNAAAQSAGVEKGMTPSQALARCLQVTIKIRSLTNEKTIGDILLQHAFTLSPLVEATAPGVATVRFTNERALTDKLASVVEQLADCEIIAQAAIAATPDTSYLAAHLARPVLQVDNAANFLAPLPIETLTLAADV
jgi:protein ImuB